MSTEFLLTSGGTLLAAGIGAFVANFIAELIKGRVRRGQALEAARDHDLAALARLLDDLSELSTIYWSSAAADLALQEPIIRAKILARQHHALEIVADLLTGDPKRECDVLFTKLMHAIAGDDFGEPQRPASPNRLAAIYQHCLSFQHLTKKHRRNLPRAMLT